AGDSEPLVASQFFNLETEKDAFAQFVKRLHAEGGGDAPENGLEGLAEAIKSDWTREGDKRRHILVLWTDTDAHPLNKNAGSKPSSYPVGMPKNLDELTDRWDGQEGMEHPAKRLIIYAPDAEPWSEIAN